MLLCCIAILSRSCRHMDAVSLFMWQFSSSSPHILKQWQHALSTVYQSVKGAKLMECCSSEAGYLVSGRMWGGFARQWVQLMLMMQSVQRSSWRADELRRCISNDSMYEKSVNAWPEATDIFLRLCVWSSYFTLVLWQWGRAQLTKWHFLSWPKKEVLNEDKSVPSHWNIGCGCLTPCTIWEHRTRHNFEHSVWK